MTTYIEMYSESINIRSHRNLGTMALSGTLHIKRKCGNNLNIQQEGIISISDPIS